MNEDYTNPKIWGPHFWFMIRCVANNYPINPTQDDNNHALNFFTELQYILPCETCKYTFKQHFNKYPVSKYLSSKDKLLEWVNIISEATKKIIKDNRIKIMDLPVEESEEVKPIKVVFRQKKTELDLQLEALTKSIRIKETKYVEPQKVVEPLKIQQIPLTIPIKQEPPKIIYKEPILKIEIPKPPEPKKIIPAISLLKISQLKKPIIQESTEPKKVLPKIIFQEPTQPLSLQKTQPIPSPTLQKVQQSKTPIIKTTIVIPQKPVVNPIPKVPQTLPTPQYPLMPSIKPRNNLAFGPSGKSLFKANSNLHQSSSQSVSIQSSLKITKRCQKCEQH